jgi:hypothetical protein
MCLLRRDSRGLRKHFVDLWSTFVSALSSNPDLLAEGWGHTAKYFESLLNQGHDLLLLRRIAGRQEPIRAGELLFRGLLNLFDCRKIRSLTHDSRRILQDY